jgi:hypothetical protein
MFCELVYSEPSQFRTQKSIGHTNTLTSIVNPHLVNLSTKQNATSLIHSPIEALKSGTSHEFKSTALCTFATRSIEEAGITGCPYIEDGISLSGAHYIPQYPDENVPSG